MAALRPPLARLQRRPAIIDALGPLVGVLVVYPSTSDNAAEAPLIDAARNRCRFRKPSSDAVFEQEFLDGATNTTSPGRGLGLMGVG